MDEKDPLSWERKIDTDHPVDYGETGQEGHVQYTVVYLMTGRDHDGYCSDVEANGSDHLVDQCVKIVRRCTEPVDHIRELDFMEPGCTSGGSGCCHGFWQCYVALKILGVSITSKDATTNNIRRY